MRQSCERKRKGQASNSATKQKNVAVYEKQEHGEVSGLEDIEKVIKGLQAHESGCGYRSHHCDDMDCPYRYGDESCDIEEMCHDALELLKEQHNEITMMKMVYGDYGKIVGELVRCEDCEYSYTEGFVHPHLICEKHPEFEEVADDWFCADGWKA